MEVHGVREPFLLLSDFNVQNLGRLLDKDSSIHPTCAPYGQLLQTLLSADRAEWSSNLTGAIVWASPNGISTTYQRIRDFDATDTNSVLHDVDMYAASLSRIPSHVRYIFVPTFSPLQQFDTRRGLLDMDEIFGVARLLMRMNLRLTDGIANDSRIHLFDSSRWLAAGAGKTFDPRLWYLAKTPYSTAVFSEAARDFASALKGLRGRAKKLLILDLDNTIWGGIVGDVGWQQLHLGGHDHKGEAYRDFQIALKALTNRGILLGIASKNEEAIALEAIRSHPEMILRPDDFAGWRINWDDKAENIAALAAELHLGLEAVVFVDDNPVERDRIRSTLPEVYVPDWPENPLLYPSALRALDCFDAPAVSAEDRNRAKMYGSERERRQTRDVSLSLDDWLSSLDLTIVAEELNQSNLQRTAQLLNKTNQMNLRTRRLSASELSLWAEDPEHLTLVFRVSDRFGDYGLVGIGSLAFDRVNRRCELADFVLSCRVMGRKVEQAMLCALAERARAAGSSILSAEFIPTSRNSPGLTFLKASGMMEDPGGRVYSLELNKPQSYPQCISLRWQCVQKDSSTPDRNSSILTFSAKQHAPETSNEG
ncbi:MAG TPA: HAD-IIIC family phosphatase [Candidatus Binataceae bacterium]|nr:HAD-IIIC family phosphatase [Candidatus Binataceae bacterium]